MQQEAAAEEAFDVPWAERRLQRLHVQLMMLTTLKGKSWEKAGATAVFSDDGYQMRVVLL